MPKVLITGHSVGNDFGLCSSCGFDHEWLLRYPSVLLWVDSILMTKSTWNSIVNTNKKDEKPFEKTTRLIFEILHSAGLLEIIDPLEILSPDISKNIVSSVEGDIEALVSRFPDSVRLGNTNDVPGQVFINQYEYCSPYLYSVYASLLLAKILNAQCLFNHRVLNFCNYKFGLGAFPTGAQYDKFRCFHSVFETLFPNEPLLPEYAIMYGNDKVEKGCTSCKNEIKCSDSYLSTTEAQVKRALLLREREEIDESRILIQKIINTNSCGAIEPSKLKDEFLKECQRLSQRNRKTFRKVKFWCSMSMMLSVPMTVVGISTSNPALLATGTATLGLSTGIKHLIDTLQEKYRWTAYFNKDYGNSEKPFYVPPMP